MDDIQLIRQLGQELTRSVQADDWSRLQKADHAIAHLLQSLTVTSVSAELRRVLQALQQHHQQMFALCQQRSDQLKDKMRQHQNQRSGLQAYALFSQEEDA